MSENSPFIEILSDGQLKCTLCPHKCILSPSRKGRCGTRINENGLLRVLTHGRFSAIAVDPVEKKPLYHFYPGTKTYSLGSAGCNMVCPFCQNSSLSQCPVTAGFSANEIPYLSPDEVVTDALAHGCKSVSFTYSEPGLSLEYALELIPRAASDNLAVIFVTNGQMNPHPLSLLSRHLSAANVDVKSFQKDVYRRTLGGDLQTTLRTVSTLHEAGVWVEVTTLIVPGMNDSDEELSSIARFISSVDAQIPWHVSRFHPAYKQKDSPPTSEKVVRRAVQIGRDAGLAYVYAGNLPEQRDENTCCPNCQDVVVDRVGYRVRTIRTENGNCSQCGSRIAGVGFP